MMYACSWKGVGVPLVTAPSALICDQLTVGRLPSHLTPFAIRVCLLTKGMSSRTVPLLIRLIVTAMTSGSLLITAYCARESAFAEIVIVGCSYEGISVSRGWDR